MYFYIQVSTFQNDPCQEILVLAMANRRHHYPPNRHKEAYTVLQYFVLSNISSPTEHKSFPNWTSTVVNEQLTVNGKKVPPLVVASLAITITFLPCTRPIPVTNPAAGTGLSYT